MSQKVREEFSKISKLFIKTHPNCQYCGGDTEHVHHLIPIAVGGDNRENNLIPLCLECHGKIHNKDFSNWKELQRIGIEKAKAAGKFKGRKQLIVNETKYYELKNKYEQTEINKTQFAELLGVSRPTLNKILSNEKQYFNI